jgi:hypothetical protein
VKTGQIEYVRGPHYEHAQRINSVLKIFGGFLLHATSVAVHAGNGTYNTTATLPTGCPIVSVNNTGSLEKYSFLVGVFRLPDGRSAALLQNQDAASRMWASVEFQDSLETVREIHPSSGEEDWLYDDSPFLHPGVGEAGMQFGIAEGGARLFVFPATTKELKTDDYAADVPPTPHQVVPYFSQRYVVVAAENFTVADPPGVADNDTGTGWRPIRWGEGNLFAATLNNVFASARALLHAPAPTQPHAPVPWRSHAVARVRTPATGNYTVLARYGPPLAAEPLRCRGGFCS